MGHFGVALFFLISGFVIPFSFLRTDARGFIIGRIFRIYPLYAAGFILTLLALALSGAHSARAFPYPAFGVFLHFLPGLHDLLNGPSIDGVIWTLDVEIKFYVVCALVAGLLRKGSPLTFAIPALLVGLVAFSHGDAWSTFQKPLAFNAEYMIFMFIGVAFNFLFRRSIKPLGFAAAACFVAGCFFTATQIAAEPPVVALSYFAALLLFSIAALLAPHWHRLAVLAFLADISYPLYVVHGVAGYALMALLLGQGVQPMIAVGLTSAAAMTVAWLLHILIEGPAHRMGRRLSRGRSAAVDPPCAGRVASTERPEVHVPLRAP